MSAELKQQLLDAVPATGEVAYGDLRYQLTNTGKARALTQFHKMRRAGEISVRSEDGKLFVGRSSGTPSTPPAQG